MDSPLREVKDNLVKDYRDVMDMPDSSEDYKAEMTEGLTKVSEQIDDLITKENYAKELAETAAKIKEGPYLKESIKAERHLADLHNDLEEAKKKLGQAENHGDVEAIAQINTYMNRLKEMQAETSGNIERLQALNQKFETLMNHTKQVGNAIETASQLKEVVTLPGTNDQMRAQFKNKLLNTQDRLNTLEVKVDGLLTAAKDAFKSIVSGIASIAQSLNESISERLSLKEKFNAITPKPPTETITANPI
jgi:uncharacterized phage infection (PIP) family protein YhgE